MIKKIGAALAATALMSCTILGNMTMVFADTTNTVSQNSTSACTVSVEKPSTFTVTIPKTITLDGNEPVNYDIGVEGDLALNKKLLITVDDIITLTDSKGKSNASASSEITKNEFPAAEVNSGSQTTGTLTGQGLSSGVWTGNLSLDIELAEDKTYGEDVTISSSNLSTYGISQQGEMIIPAEVKDESGIYHKVKTIGNGNYSTGILGTQETTSIVISEGIETISDYAFENCLNLSKITMPDSITTIGNYAFKGCSNLSGITIPNNVTNIGISAFEDCSSLTKIIIPDSVKKINGNAFKNCTGLTEINIPDKEIILGNYIFEGCTGLTEITFPGHTKFISYSDGPTSTSVGTFKNCTGLTKATILSGMAKVEDYTFEGCTNLIEVILPDTIKGLGNNSFSDCTSLKTIAIPSSLTYMGSDTFENCTNLTEIVGINNCIGLTEITGFSNCTSLTEITIPDSVETIDSFAFSNCTGLTEITIPDSVKTISMYAFNKCTNLTSVIYKGTTYTTKSSLSSALKANGVKCDSDAFNNAGLK